jgi:pilus assembly protein CpaE
LAQLSFVVYCEVPDLGTSICELLGRNGHAHVVARVSRPEELAQTLARSRADALFACLGSDPDRVLGIVEALPAPRPLLLTAGPQDQSQLILRAMRVGAKEFFSSDFEEEAVAEALGRLVLEHQPTTGVRKIAPVLAVMGVKGGVGATFVTCQLAAQLQSRGSPSLILDLNIPLGDVGLHFDMQPAYTLANLAREQNHVDGTYLRTILHRHRSGVEVLAAPSQIEEAELVLGHHVEHAIRLLRTEFDWLVLDVSRSWSDASVRALDLADQILLVTSMDVPTLNHARQHIEILKKLGIPATKTRLVANRCSNSDAVVEQDFARFLGRKPDHRIPNDYQTASACVNEGKTIGDVASRSSIYRGFMELADEAHGWCGVERFERAREERNLLARLRQKVGLIREVVHGNH